jgi:hypothetical protein
LDEVRGHPNVVLQMHEFGCGAACGEMLLRDRGLEVDQLTIAGKLRLPRS